MATAGLVFASTRRSWLLLVAGTIGVISPSGHDVGPFLSIEQAALSHVVTDRTRTTVFAWYTLAGSLATAARRAGGRHARRRPATDASDTRQHVSRGRHPVRRAGREFWRSCSLSLSPASEAVTSGERRVRRSPLADIAGLDRSRDVVRKAVGAVRAGLVRRRFRHSELCRLLVLPALRRQPGSAWRDLLLGQHPGRPLGARSRPAGVAIRPGQDDGRHPPAVEHPADSRAADANAAACHRRYCSCGSASARWTCRRGSPT